MLILTQISLSIYGDSFSPSKIKESEDLKFDNKNEVGDIGKRGRYKGKPIPYGGASLYIEKKFPVKEKDGDELIPSSFLDLIENNMDSFKNAGGTDIELRLSIFWKDQCNFDFSPDLIKRIGNLNIPFLISCYDDDE
ncbi:MAG: hypothetical protein H6622_10220 [Halobacteriovoraceae bacterium]|nr:hypothetical protein [Halobacteriovoraceae bacterium]